MTQFNIFNVLFKVQVNPKVREEGRRRDGDIPLSDGPNGTLKKPTKTYIIWKNKLDIFQWFK